MSVLATNSSKFQEFHGLKLASGAAIANLIAEKLASDPISPEAGRFWYNITTKTFRMVVSDESGENLVVKSFATAEALGESILAFQNSLAASTGSTLVGSATITGANGEFSLVEGTLAEAIAAIAAAIDTEIKERKESSSDVLGELASQDSEASGSTLVGYGGTTTSGGSIVLNSGTVEDAIDSLAQAVETHNDARDAQFDTISQNVLELQNDYVSKSETSDQVIASNLEILQNVIIRGDVQILGANTEITGTTVTLGDNIILLNSEVAPDAEPVADAGWQVNRGVHGILNAMLWSESTKELTGVTVTTDGEGVETEVRSRVILGTEFDAFDADVDGRLVNLEGQIDGKLGDLATLATEDKSTIVAAVNELHTDAATFASDLVGVNGLTMVGDGTKTLATILSEIDTAQNDKDTAIGTLVDDLDALEQVVSNDKAALASSAGATLVGTAGFGLETDPVYIPEGTVENALDILAQAQVTALGEIDTLAQAQTSMGTDLVNAVNATKFVTVSAAATVHTIAHNLNSTDITVNVWFKDGTDWVNHSASCRIVDADTIEFTLTTAAELKVLVNKFDDITLN